MGRERRKGKRAQRERRYKAWKREREVVGGCMGGARKSPEREEKYFFFEGEEGKGGEGEVGEGGGVSSWISVSSLR